MKRTSIVFAALCVLSVAHAESRLIPTTDEQFPALGDSAGSAALVPAASSRTEGQARDWLAGKGYSDIADLKMGENGAWTASAKKDGKPFEVSLDLNGKITETAR